MTRTRRRRSTTTRTTKKTRNNAFRSTNDSSSFEIEFACLAKTPRVQWPHLLCAVQMSDAKRNEAGESKTEATKSDAKPCPICNTALDKDCVTCVANASNLDRGKQGCDRIAEKLPDIESPCLAATGACGHVFHYDCIDRWLAYGRDDCPCCDNAGLWKLASGMAAIRSYAWGVGVGSYIVAHRVPTAKLEEIYDSVRALFCSASKTALGVVSGFPRAESDRLAASISLLSCRGPRVEFFLVVDGMSARATVGDFATLINDVLLTNGFHQKVSAFVSVGVIRTGDDPLVGVGAGRVLCPVWSRLTASTTTHVAKKAHLSAFSATSAAMASSRLAASLSTKLSSSACASSASCSSASASSASSSSAFASSAEAPSDTSSAASTSFVEDDSYFLLNEQSS